MNRVLVVDDEPGMREALRASFRQRGWEVDTACGPPEAMLKFRPAPHPLVVSDIRMPGGNGLELMRDLRRISPPTAVILLTAFGSVPDAVRAMRDGACDYLVKPVSFEQLEAAANRVLARSSGRVSEDCEFVGHSPVLLAALERARRVAASDADILIEAESGTGKELLARLIHRSSPRRDQPMVAVNCAACPETLLESELFGHVKGAFTGALAAKPGKFELANHGTLLLDEVGEMPVSLQAKLLRVLQEREVDRLGGTHSVRLDLRVIATTNRPLLAMVEQGAFRSDLYYRLNVIPLSLPALREHREDIPELAEHFAQLWAGAGPRVGLTPEFLAQLARHSWPGNVRELANFVRRAVTLSRDGRIAADGLASLNLAPPPSAENARAGTSLRELERQLFESTLAATGGNRSRTAELLGVSLRTVRNKIRDYGLPPRGSYAHD